MKKTLINFIILVAIGVVLFFLIKKILWFIVSLVALIIVFAVLLIFASKNSNSEQDNDVKNQLRDMLSKVRRQKFKAESNIRRFKELANSAIYTTYSNLFGAEYTKEELLDKYQELKEKYADKVQPAQQEKLDKIVDSYQKMINSEKAKMEVLERLEQKYNDLYDKLKKAKIEQAKSKKLDKHMTKIKQISDTQGIDEIIITSDLTYDDLKQDIEYKIEYMKQLDELNEKYSLDSLDDTQVIDYSNEINEILKNLE